MYYIICFISSLISFILGIYFLTKFRKERIISLCLSFGFFLLGINEGSNFFILKAQTDPRLFWCQNLSLGMGGLLSLLWLYLSLIFAKPDYKPIIKRWSGYLELLVFASIVFLFLGVRSRLIVNIKDPQIKGFFLSFWGWVGALFILFNFIISFFNFETTYRCIGGERHKFLRKAIRGISICTVSNIIWLSLLLLYRFFGVGTILFLSAGRLVGISQFGYAYLRYRLANSEFYVRRDLVYSWATLLVVGLYFILLGLITRLLIHYGINLRIFLDFLGAFFAFFIFLSLVFSKRLKEGLCEFIDRTFYKGNYDFRRIWATCNERFGSDSELNQLIKKAVETISEIIGTKRVELFLWDEMKKRYLRMNGLERASSDGEMGFSEDNRLLKWLSSYERPVRKERLIKDKFRSYLYEENRELLNKLEIEVIVPLIAKQRMLGILGLGSRNRKENYYYQELELLRLIGMQMAVAIINAKLSKDLISAREMESFQRIASFVIHDLKNLITSLSLVVYNADRCLNVPQFQKDTLKVVATTVKKMDALIQRLSGLPRELDLRLRQIDLYQLIEEVIFQLEPSKPKGISLVKRFSLLPLVKVDPHYMKKVLFNLFLNAFEAMNGGGIVTVETKGDSLRDLVEITISDTGPGIPEEFLRHQLFKPFQTTKNKGLGIGLFQCKTIVEAHGGCIEAESRLEKGAVFRISLPVVKIVNYGLKKDDEQT